MEKMETILVYPKNPDKMKALKAFLKALKIDFEKSPYNPDFVSKIKRSDEDIKAGRTSKITPDDIWK
jgi:hypothetical protein